MITLSPGPSFKLELVWISASWAAAPGSVGLVGLVFGRPPTIFTTLRAGVAGAADNGGVAGVSTAAGVAGAPGAPDVAGVPSLVLGSRGGTLAVFLQPYWSFAGTSVCPGGGDGVAGGGGGGDADAGENGGAFVDPARDTTLRPALERSSPVCHASSNWRCVGVET